VKESEAQTAKPSTQDAAAVDDVVSDDGGAAANGWTPEALRAYHAEREAAAAAVVFRPRARPATANSRYRVFRCWSR